MEKQKINGIPSIGEIILESSKDQWGLFRHGITNKFSTTALVIVDQEDRRKVRITIAVKKIIEPSISNLQSTVIPIEVTGFDTQESGGIIAADQFFRNCVDKTIWVFIGYITGKVNKPIIVLYYEKFNFATYSIVTNEDDLKKYFPEGVPQTNPNLN